MKAGAAVVVTGLLLGAATALSPTADASSSCTPWSVSTVASGFGMLENLEFDGRGSMVVSETSPIGPGALRTVAPGGDRGTLVADVESPGGLVTDGDTLYFTTGNSAAAGFFDTRTGTVDTIDLGTGVRSTYASGLAMPNGLARSETGDLFTTRNLGVVAGLSRIATDRTVSTVRTDVGTANGIGIGGGKIYVANTFDLETTLTVLDANNPSGPSERIRIDGIGPLTMSDDLTVADDGTVYLAQNLAGRVVRIDPETGSSCVMATGVPLTSSVAFGGVGFDEKALYATSFDGTVRKMSQV
ncbi:MULTISPECIES: SMP-30/gluconolactonase/LRE family protein [unclassified Rhodococcus (in: high G+C Gram-positive bacteria)]|uniref:SMP-30/gluconolactonase/LRE family protein n=1 Tax=unclassified Rhodococcus (in: high G+C Gram-positive bacteria) TaxID=192944 RepID=UPI00117A4CE2|nr:MULTISPECIES: SMP-30/gluconolactonase/LRE family protein [unclassified Rhodococcus (in: high G+C Gram-positive bacteria)]